MTEVTMRADRCEGPEGEPLTRFQLVVAKDGAGRPCGALRGAESTLLQALGCQLARSGPAELFDLAVDGVAGRGWCAVTAVPTAQGLERVRGAFEMTAAGFLLLARRFPDQVRVQAGDTPAPERKNAGQCA